MGAVALLAIFAGARVTGATPPPATDPNARASFALIIGVNASVDSDAPPLRYADDDAARYLDLFRSLGARSYVLTRLDENTRRLHPQVAAEAEAPVAAEYARAIQALASDVEQARQRNVKTVVYFVYAGHGAVRDGRGYITLEDARLDSAVLENDVLKKVNADQTHFIVDACYSYFLALGRGPGGQRHEVHGFTELGGLGARGSVGLLFSTSSAKESHEWAAYQAGVFSHEVRSGLYGAADADGDGQVSYREIAAFIDRANAAIANERYRSEVFARPPKDSDVLMDLRNRTGARIDARGARADHYFLEDSRGVRFADFHNATNQNAYLLRPLSAGRLYLHRTSDDAEFVVPTTPEIVALAELVAQEPRMRIRGAANDAFQSLFALPFSQRTVETFRYDPLASARDRDEVLPVEKSRARFYAGITLLSAGVAGAAVGLYGLESAHGVGSASSQADAVAINDKIHSRNLMGGIGLAAGGVAAGAGLALLLWPDQPTSVAVSPSLGVATLTLRTSAW